MEFGKMVQMAKVAHDVLNRYFCLSKGEQLLIVTDTNTPYEIAQILALQAKVLDAIPVVLVMEALENPGVEPPKIVSEAMKTTDVLIAPVSTSLFHTNAKEEARKAGVRGVPKAPANLETWCKGGMTADHELMLNRNVRLLTELFEGVSSVRVTTPAGTDVTVQTGGRPLAGARQGICHNKGEISVLPGGEVSFPPLEGTAEGVFVIEHFIDKPIGLLDMPITVTVKKGKAVNIEGGKKAGELRKILDTVENADNIAEIGIGFNPCSIVGLDLYDSKRAAKTAHTAFGDSSKGGYGGKMISKVHLDGLLLNPTIYFDDKVIVDNGEPVYLMLGKDEKNNKNS